MTNSCWQKLWKEASTGYGPDCVFLEGTLSNRWEDVPNSECGNDTVKILTETY